MRLMNRHILFRISGVSLGDGVFYDACGDPIAVMAVKKLHVFCETYKVLRE